MLNWGDEAVFSRVFPVYDKVNGDNYDLKNMLDRKRSFMREGKWVTNELPEAELKLYPEGGHLIEGIETTVAYELFDDEGKPGKDSIFIFADKELLLKSAPAHAGVGTFRFTPKSDIKYRAEVKRGKKKHKFELPKIEPRGVVINLAQSADSINVIVKNNIDFSTPLGIAVLNRGFLIDYQSFEADEKEKYFNFATDSLPEGVNRVVIFANSNIPLTERQFFVRHKKILPGDRQTVKLTAKVNGLAPNDIILQPHEKIILTVEREDGKPIAEDAEFSVSVSDAATRQTMSYTHNMYTHMLLGSEIKGYIPELHTGTSTDMFDRRGRSTTRRYTTIKGYNESKQFYSPNYKYKKPYDKKDVRRTLIWVPSVKSANGKLTIELYNSAITQKPIIDIEGVNGRGILYGTCNSLANRILSGEQPMEKKIYSSRILNNPAILAYSFKITTEGRNLYREKEYERAFEKFYEAAALGYTDAMLYAGICYTNGEGVEQDSVKAFRMFRGAANGKHIAAMHNLANCYMQGIGTTANNSMALKWYTAAADNGYTRSMSMLAKSYEEGIFTEKNSEKAIEWYKRAAEKEEVLNMFS